MGRLNVFGIRTSLPSLLLFFAAMAAGNSANAAVGAIYGGFYTIGSGNDPGCLVRNSITSACTCPIGFAAGRFLGQVNEGGTISSLYVCDAPAIALNVSQTFFSSSPANITLTASVADPEHTLKYVAYYYASDASDFAPSNGGQISIGYSSTAPFSVTWSGVRSRTYMVTAVATDNNGGTATSAPVLIQVGGTPPTAPTFSSINSTIIQTSCIACHSPGAPSTAPTFSFINSTIIQTSCVACHNPSNPSGTVDLSTYQQVLNQVRPGNPNTSPLYVATSTHVMPPPPGSALSDAQVQAIGSWIAAGACDTTCPPTAPGIVDLSTYQQVLNQVTPGNPNTSPLYLVTSSHAMPPPPGTALSDAQVQAIGSWIAAGACDTNCPQAVSGNPIGLAYGGMYSITYGGFSGLGFDICNVPNSATGTCSCPTGFHPSLAIYPGSNRTLFICEGPAGSPSAVSYGGAFQNAPSAGCTLADTYYGTCGSVDQTLAGYPVWCQSGFTPRYAFAPGDFGNSAASGFLCEKSPTSNPPLTRGMWGWLAVGNGPGCNVLSYLPVPLTFFGFTEYPQYPYGRHCTNADASPLPDNCYYLSQDNHNQFLLSCQAPAPSTWTPSGLSVVTNPTIFGVGAPIQWDNLIVSNYSDLTNTTSAGIAGAVPVYYSVSPPLPPGLGLNPIGKLFAVVPPFEGIIFGTPTVASPPTNYTVTASNSYGSTSTVLNITVVDQITSLSYSMPTASYTAGTAIAPNSPSYSGGPARAFSVSPALPSGLSIDQYSGVITGTPSTVTPTASYFVTATNLISSISTSITITVAAPFCMPNTNIGCSCSTSQRQQCVELGGSGGLCVRTCAADGSAYGACRLVNCHFPSD